MAPLGVSLSWLMWACTQGAVEVDSSTILDPFRCNQFMSGPKAVSSFKGCALPPSLLFHQEINGGIIPAHVESIRQASVITPSVPLKGILFTSSLYSVVVAVIHVLHLHQMSKRISLSYVCSETNWVLTLVCCAVFSRSFVSTLCNPMNCSLPGFSVHGAIILEWVTIPSSRRSSQPRNWTQVSALQVDCLPSEPPGKPKKTGLGSLSLLQGILPFSRGSSWPRDWTHVSCISFIGRWILYH